MGVWARDEVGQQAETAAVEWFRAAADLLNDYALNNLGRMYLTGRGGLPVDRVQAVKLLRAAAQRDNAWALVRLAEALETGEGTERNLTEAVGLLPRRSRPGTRARRRHAGARSVGPTCSRRG